MAGADIIMGHHPNAYQAYKQYFIAYVSFALETLSELGREMRALKN